MTAGVSAIRWLAGRGVREFVICAGARNCELVVALAAVPSFRIWSHFEERSAAFFALGRVRASGSPVAVVTTSGTAVAELLPAVIEAAYQGLPLVALTADRPAGFRGSGAPQAIEQAGLFGGYAVGCDLVPGARADEIRWDGRRPLHVNLPLEEPDAALLERARAEALAVEWPEGPPRGRGEPDADPPPAWPGERYDLPLVILGDLLPVERDAVREFVRRLGVPVHAEAASGLRECPELAPLALRGGDRALQRVNHRSVIRIGGVPCCRFWRDLEDRPEVPVLSLSRSGHRGLGRVCDVLPLRADWLRKWASGFSGDRSPRPRPAAAGTLDALLAAYPRSEPALVRAVAAAIPEGAAVLTGNSLPVREWNLCAPVDVPRPAWALRGANGIDGNLSAFLGYAADAGEAWAITGDLTALYDLAAPWMMGRIPCPRIRLAIIHNEGGRIFARVPSLTGLTDAERAIMENPHRLSFAAWAALWGMEHRVVAEPGAALARLPDRVVLEIRPDPEETAAFEKAWAEAARS